ncbi:MAG: dihydroorotate dehydrogenase electron transfer subunit [Candidatus Accumulibacter sp.]|jgi:dihydroorotate dehydrogenase electron transfer subunit|nr:dihydroorotate dehydrogenase electron transfer subunit [Accumulibacter sp.]
MLTESSLLFNTQISPSYWHARLCASAAFVREAAPGRFVMLRVNDTTDPLLRRPFAIFDADDDASGAPVFEILYRVVGKATTILSAKKEGDVLDVLGPLGKGFDLGAPAGEHLLVGGGVGLAPLYALAKKLRAASSTVLLFAGGRRRDDILCAEAFASLGVECHFATEDGSIGERALVTEPLTRYLESQGAKAAIYACGPEGMLRAVAQIAARRAIPCQVSLESRMACGVGVCLGCVVAGRRTAPQTPDFRCVCSEGPVFDANEIDWEGA